MIVKTFDKTVLSISDDSGFLALVNAERYKSFVGSDLNSQQLQQRFTEQSKAQTIFIWETGSEGFHNVAIIPEPTTQTATKEFKGQIEVTRGCIYLTNYEDLSMAAQFDNENLPAAHNSDLIIHLPNAGYNVTVRQLTYLDNAPEHDERIDFEICLIARN